MSRKRGESVAKDYFTSLIASSSHMGELGEA